MKNNRGLNYFWNNCTEKFSSTTRIQLILKGKIALTDTTVLTVTGGDAHLLKSLTRDPFTTLQPQIYFVVWPSINCMKQPLVMQPTL